MRNFLAGLGSVLMISPRERKHPRILPRVIREGDRGPFCERCGSSFKRKFIFFRSSYCVNPECVNSKE